MTKPDDDATPITHAGPERPARPTLRQRLDRRVKLSLAGLVATTALSGGAGFALSQNIPYGDRPMLLMDGEARLHNKQNWLTSVDNAETGEQLSFHAEAVAWSAASSHGEGPPPCLRVGRDVPVRVGYTSIELPDGGSRQVVAWVRCL